MATVIGGYDTGLLDSSLYLLDKNNSTSEGTTGHDEELYVNVSNGNLIVRHTDSYLPSQGEDFAVVRTYNEQGNWNEGVGQNWTITTAVELTQITNGDITLRNADGSYYTFILDRATDSYISTDGVGAYETIYEDADGNYILTRSDQTKITFDLNGDMLQSVDTNGNTITYVYESSKLIQVIDDTGHTITYVYGGDQGSELSSIVDSELGVLVEYTYDFGLLVKVVDRSGDVTTYDYYTDGSLARINLPHDPTIEADIGKERSITFINGGDDTLDYIIDAEGNVTEFIYNFDMLGSKFYGGTTLMVNALGYERYSSNELEYVQWRLENGYYETWDYAAYEASYYGDQVYYNQTNEIRSNHATHYYYDAAGNITLAGTYKTTDGNLNYEYADRYEYDADGNLITILDANSYTLQYSDDQYWRDMRQSLGYVDITGEGLLSSQLTSDQRIELAEFYTTHLEYDGNGNLIKKTDNEDNVTTFTYTSFNKISTETNAKGLTTVYSYDANQNLIEIRTPSGDLTTFTYDSFGNVTNKTVYMDQTDLVDPAKQQITLYFYDAYGNNIKTIEANAWSITNSDDAYWVQMRKEFGVVDANSDGKLVADLSAADIDVLNGQYTSFNTYDLFGNLTQYIDPNGGVTTYTYDNDNRLLTVTDPELSVTAYRYDSVGNRIGVTTTSDNHTTVYVYDRNNMLIAVQDWKTELGNGEDDRTTTYKYDVVGNQTAVTDANGIETIYIYREDNRLIEILTPVVEDGSGNPAQYSTTFAYDALGNRIQVNDNNGNITNYVYNQNNLVKQTTDPIGNVTQYSYDANLNQVQIIIGAQLAETQRRVLNYSYDDEDQLIASVDAEGNTTRYTLDANGNRVQVIDALGRTYEFEYDAQNRQIIETKPEVIHPESGQPVSYTVIHYFDGNNNEIATTDENGNTTHVSYDRDNRAVLITDANDIKTAFTYDAKDNQTGVYINVDAHIDADKQVVIDNDDQAQVTTYSYDEFNQIYQRVDGLGNALVASDEEQYIQMRAELGYVDINGDGKLVADLTDLEKAELTARYTERYSYDKVGNLTQTIDNAGNETNAVYDGMNRQTSVTDALGNTTSTRYDGNSNQVSVTDALGRTTSFSYDNNDRLIDTTDAHGVVTHREYDDFGNLRYETQAYGTIDARTTELRYDLNSRLIDSIDPLGQTQTHYEYDAVGNNTSQTTAYGTVEAQTTSFRYDALNRTIQTTDALDNITQYDYDGVGNQVKLIDAKGGLTEFVYDPSNRLVETTDAEGRVNSFTYDDRNNRITTTDGNGNVTNFEYDAENNLRAVVDAEGNRTENNYDTVYNRVSTTDGNGNTTNYAFDAVNRQIAVTDALGNTTSYEFDAVGNSISITDALSHTRTFAYDDLNRAITETDAAGIQTTYTYDSVSNSTSITYAANTAQAATSTFEYNKDNQLISQTDALGNITSYTYDANHNVLTITDANSGVITNTYDDVNRLITTADALGHQTSFVYDANGNQVQLTDANGSTSTTYYNKNNEIDLSVDNLGYATSYEYDDNGNIISRTQYMTALVGPQDPGNEPVLTTSSSDQTISYEYNQLNLLSATVDAEGNRTATTYDAVGNAVTLTDGNGNITTFTYNEVNRLNTTTDAEGGVTTNYYDEVGNRTSRTDANGNTTEYTFDVNNRLETTTDALGNITSNVYDAVGNRTSVTDANNNTTTYFYDLNNRLLKQTDSLGVETTYTYDDVGNRLTMTTAANTAIAATTTYVYDADNNMISMTDALGNITSYAYDANHNRLSMTDANGGVTSYVYDDNNQLISKTDPENNTISYVYDTAGNQVQRTDANGNVTTSYFNANNDLSISVDALGYATSYVYDGNGNILSQTVHLTQVGVALDPNIVPTLSANAYDRTISFEYDSLNRTTASIDGEGFRTTFVYDAVGNQTETHQQISADGQVVAVTHTYYDEVNRLTHNLSAEGYLTSYTYDAVGNRTSSTVYSEKVSVPVSGDPIPVEGDLGRTTSYAYDSENRQISQTSALGIITAYEYDERGNRTAIIDAQGSLDERTTSFSYDNLNRLIDTTNANGVISHNVYDNEGNIIERYDAYGSAEQRLTTYTYDGNNRVLTETNAIGVTTSYSYDANGNRLSTTLATGVVGVERTLTSTYDANNRALIETNGEGETTQYFYDGAGNRVLTVEAMGLAEQRYNLFEYDLDNRVVATLDALGTRTEYTYDGAGNKILTVQAVGLSEQRTSEYSYNLDNQLVQVTDPEMGVTQYSYDALGNQSQVIDANGGVQVNTFDAVGQPVTSLSAGGVLSTSVYDDRGNLISFTQSNADGSDAQTISYGYDAIDQQTTITDGEGFTTTITYDEFGNQTHVVNGEYLVDVADPSYDATKAARSTSTVTSFTYDSASRMLSMTDGEGSRTEYTYDEVGNRLTLTKAANDPELTLTTSYQYDLANRLTQTVTPEGGIVNQTYDAVGNKTGETLLQGYDELGAEIWITKSFEYSNTGKLTAEVDGEGVRTEYGYDAMGNMITQRYAAGTTEERVVRMEYDLNNRITAEIDAEGNRTEFSYDAQGNRITATDALGRVAHFYFNADNQLVTSLDPEGYINSFSYDASGNQTEVKVYMTRYTGSVDDLIAPLPTESASDRSTQYIYDNANQLVLEIDAEGNETRYEYNGSGNKTQETLYANSAAPLVMNYEYDDSSRLVQFTDVDGTVTTFAYDAANNKISESIYNAEDPNNTRTTVFTYDLNNRETSSVFDPAGLALTQEQSFDKLGNLLTTTDKNGTVTSYTYDLNNRMLSSTVDPSGLAITTSYTYDEVGNRISMTDARGNTTDYVYNDNNQLIEEKLPQVDIYSITGGDELGVRPNQTYAYDASGNQVQIVDSNGFATTTYYDSNNRVVAEIDGVNTLREYTYNAAGERITETVYMTQLTSADHDISTRPAAPSGETRLYTMEYDKAGRLTRTVYPETTITTLSNTDSDAPTATTASVSAEVVNNYDAFGNLVEVFDMNGNRSVSYYDVNGRQTAVVDAEGYMIEWEYDQQGNVLEQRTYATQLDTSLIDSSIYPATPAGEVYVVSRTYDVAGNMLTEMSPTIAVYNPLDPANPLQQQQVIVNSYDDNGNLTSTTIAAGTSSETTEYSYYDAANRRVAIINGERVLHTYNYDANGNVTQQTRYLSAIDSSVDLSLLTADSDFLSYVTVNANGDQTTTFNFDAVNRITSETDIMGPGTDDDITQVYKYNATALRTSSQNAEGYITQNQYDANGNVIVNISADGSGTLLTYDAVGNNINAYTGQIDNQTTAATNIAVTVGDQLNISWDLGGTVDMGSRVVYSTSSQASIDGYTSQTGFIGSWGLSSASANIDLSSFTAGSEVYFRVVTQDAAGNTSWTEEKMITIPPRVTDVSISQPATDSLEINASFDEGAVNPVLLYGAAQNPTTEISFVKQLDGTYTATLTGVTNLEDLVYKIQWQQELVDSDGVPYTNTYSSAEQPFEATGNHVAVTTTAGEGTLSTGGYEINIHSEVPTALAEDLTVVSAQWRPVGSDAGYYATANSGVLDIDGAFYSFDLTLSQETAITAGDYEIIITGALANGDEIVLDTFNYTVGSATPEILTSQSVSWQAADVGDSQVVIVDGLRVDSSRQDSYASFDVDLVAASTQDYQVYYSDSFADTHTTDLNNMEISHTVDVNSTEVTSTDFTLDVAATFSDWEVSQMAGGVTLSYRLEGSADAYTNVALTQAGNSFSTALTGLAAGQYELQLSYTDINAATVVTSTTIADTAVATNSSSYTTGYNLNINSVLSAAEVANISGDVTLYYRDADTGLDFANSKVMTLNTDTNTLSASLENISAGQYDIKLEYTDVSGQTVIIDWSRSDTSVTNTSITASSETLLGSEEQNGLVTLGANSVITVDPGLFVGELGSESLFSQLSLNPINTGLAGDTQDANGQSTGYYTQTTFNALDATVAELGQDGLYREYGVDANGNKVATYLFGEQGAATSIDSYSAYDSRNRVVAEFDAAFIPDGESLARHPVTRYEYNVNDVVTKQTDALGNTTYTEYNALGSKTSYKDENNSITTYQYDIRGNEVAVTDASGNTARKEYDANGNLVAEVNGEGDYIRYSYDAFGRKESMIKGLDAATPIEQGNTTSYTYDQHDNVTSMTDAMGGVSRYDYDKLDQQTWAYDTRYNPDDNSTYTFKVGQEYDALGRVVASISYQGGKDVTTSTTTAVLDDFGNPVYYENGDPVTETVITTTFVGGDEVRETATYDVYGNRIAETDGEGRVKTTTFGAASRAIEEVDEGGQLIIKEYDQYGQLVHEYDPNGDKDIVRSYDFNGNLVSIVDNDTEVTTTYTYDIAGNRISEIITTPVDAQDESTHNRAYSYTYDSRGNMVRWADSETGMHLNYWYDEAGNLQRVFTDVLYDPDGQNITIDPDTLEESPTDLNFRHVDHWYYYDSANRLATITNSENGEIVSGYTYDNAGNRETWNNQGTEVTYSFNANGQVEQAIYYTGTGDSQVENKQVWKYDSAGNVVDYRTYKDGAEDTYATYKYFENNKQWYSFSDGTRNTYTFDKSGRTTNMQLVDGLTEEQELELEPVVGSGYFTSDNDWVETLASTSDGDNTYNYVYSYYADGREKSIKANGDASGGSSFTYDSNEKQIRVDKGDGDGQDRNQYSTFMYDNDGHIMYKWADDGESSTHEKVEYAYANGNPVGETGNDVDGTHTTKLDTGNYSTVKNIGDEFPATSVTMYTVNPGDTLQSIASAMYGNPSLWYVIAEANSLNGTEELKAGSKLQVPNTVANGSLTSEAHALYQEGDIIGSSLPNLVSPPPSGGGCGGLLSIIIVVVIAAVAYYFLGPAANGIASSLFGTTIAAASVTTAVVSYAIAGALVYAAANIVQQGLFIALGYQDSFEWGQVGDAAITGIFTGAAAGVASLGTAANVASSATSIAPATARIAASAIKVAGAVVGQYIKDGEITSWTSIAVAALGSTKASNVDGSFNADIDMLDGLGQVSGETLGYVTPWLQLAETYVRNDGELEPADWANAVSGTITNATNSNADASNQLDYRLMTNMFVGGALAHYDSAAAESYFANAVGNEIGQLIGGQIVGSLRADRANDKDAAAVQAALGERNIERTEARAEEARLASATSPTMFASLGGGDIMSDAGSQYGPIQVGDVAESPYTDEELIAAWMQGQTDAANLGEGTVITDDLYGLGIGEENETGLPDGSLTNNFTDGDSGDAVTALQNRLLNLGYELPEYNADGHYGDETDAAYEQYRSDLESGILSVSEDGTHSLNLTGDQQAIVNRLIYERQGGLSSLAENETEYSTILRIAQNRVTGSAENNTNVTGELGAGASTNISNTLTDSGNTAALRTVFERNFSEGGETLTAWNAETRAQTIEANTSASIDNIEDVNGTNSRGYLLSAARALNSHDAGNNPITFSTEYIRFAHTTSVPSTQAQRTTLDIINVPDTIQIRSGRTGPGDAWSNHPWR